MNNIEYAYSEGDRLNNRNSYFYTPGVGMPMIQAWSHSRKAIASKLPDPGKPPDARCSEKFPFEKEELITTNILLEWLAGRVFSSTLEDAETYWIEKILQKFEVSKRIYTCYMPNMKLFDNSKYNDLGNYIRCAEIFVSAFDLSSDVRYLNLILKITDTLCALHLELSEDQKGRLHWLINEEEKRVEGLLS